MAVKGQHTRNWYEDSDGWHKDESSHDKGNADYFSKPLPPVRDSNGFPLKPGGGIDWDKLYEERNAKH